MPHRQPMTKHWASLLLLLPKRTRKRRCDALIFPAPTLASGQIPFVCANRHVPAIKCGPRKGAEGGAESQSRRIERLPDRLTRPKSASKAAAGEMHRRL